MTSAPILRVFSEALETAIPASELTVSSWADTYRYLPPERARRHGKWDTGVVPYSRDIMDAASDPAVRKIIFWKSSQIAGTEICNNIIGYYIHVKPSPILYVCENEGKAKAWSQECLAPTIRDTPVLEKLVHSVRSRDSGNTIEAKRFPGGHLAVAWATSPATLSSRPRRVVVFDEVDGFKSTPEGDPITLGEARTKTFEDDCLVVLVSSPRDDETSKIKPAYEESYRGKYWVPCPHCGEFQTLEWKDDVVGYRIRMDDGATEAYYICKYGCLIEHDHKQEMLTKGEWRFEGEFTDTIGFFIWEGYSPFVSWTKIVRTFKAAKKKYDQTGDVEDLKAVVNTSLAQTWKPYDTEVDIGDLPKRCEVYESEVPEGVLVLTASADLQGDRIEYEILGTGLDHETWSIHYGVIYGDPSQKDVWLDLKDALLKGYIGPDGLPMYVKAACIDTGGHHTEEAMRFCRANKGRRWWAVKGASTSGRPIVPKKPSKAGRPPVDLWLLGTETAKDTFAARLRKKEQGPGYCHFPTKFDENKNLVYDESYFKQLVSEQPVIQKGSGVRAWKKIKEGMRNEALDLRVYNMAALAILKPDLPALAAKRASQKQPPTPNYNPPAAVAVEQEQKQRPQRRPRQGGFSLPKNSGFGAGWNRRR